MFGKSTRHTFEDITWIFMQSIYFVAICHACPHMFIHTTKTTSETKWPRYCIFKCILLNENVSTLIKNIFKCVPNGLISNILALTPKMTWHRSSDKLLFEPMMVMLQTYMCVTRPQWVNYTRFVVYRTSNDICFNMIYKAYIHIYITYFETVGITSLWCDFTRYLV